MSATRMLLLLLCSFAVDFKRATTPSTNLKDARDVLRRIKAGRVANSTFLGKVSMLNVLFVPV